LKKKKKKGNDQTNKRKHSPKFSEYRNNDPPTKRIKLILIPQLAPEKLTSQTKTQTRNNNNKINKNTRKKTTRQK